MDIKDLTRITLEEFRKSQPKEDELKSLCLTKTHSIDNQVKAVSSSEDRIIQAILSSETVDTAADSISIKGWDLKWFKKQGTILWAHERSLPPIGKPLEVWISPDKTQLVGTAKMTPADMPHPLGPGFGHTIYRMFVEGYLKNVSVGFMPLKYEFSSDDTRMGGIDFIKQRLLEWSPVPIGANPDAHGEALIKGIDLTPLYRWAELALDTSEYSGFDRKEIEEYYKIIRSYAPKISTTNVEEALDKTEESLSVKQEDQTNLSNQPDEELELIEEEAEKMQENLPQANEIIENQDPSVVDEESEEDLPLNEEALVEEEDEEEATSADEMQEDKSPSSLSTTIDLNTLSFEQIKSLYNETETAHVDAVCDLLDQLDFDKCSQDNKTKLNNAFVKFAIKTKENPEVNTTSKATDTNELDLSTPNTTPDLETDLEEKALSLLSSVLTKLDVPAIVSREIDRINGKLVDLD